jgi:hypothetical protein
MDRLAQEPAPIPKNGLTVMDGRMSSGFLNELAGSMRNIPWTSARTTTVSMKFIAISYSNRSDEKNGT